MLPLLISAAVSAASVAACVLTNTKSETAGFCGVAGFFVTYFLVGFLVRRKVKAVQNELQEQMESGQKRMSRKIQQFQSKPNGNIKAIQRQLEKDQMEMISSALDFTKRLEPFKKWSTLMGRQIDTIRMQFLYQLKEFEQVDELLAKKGLFKGPMMMEPITLAMKMARQYKNDDIKGAEKTFKRRIKWFRGSRGSLLYGLMSWIYMKQGESEKARQLLLKGKEATSNEALASNWQLLSNNKDKSFSNAGLGEEWYALYLENPPTPKPQRMRGDARGGRGF
ncbi:MAG: hypothetical protein ISR85_01265 [Kiritimatiellales bacterium]|nr:hypothetical protein [Kiritimatiellota bacterium]MBL7011542.1 hypothetical protein [Kiritimatiellales bacterium]